MWQLRQLQATFQDVQVHISYDLTLELRMRMVMLISYEGDIV